jgi:elongation factor Ts
MPVTITASLVNELRTKSGAGMMDCKKALVETDGDMEKAMDILRKKGAATAAKRADREVHEGVILTKVSDDHHHGVIVEVNCETDFVAKSDDFMNFVKSILDKSYAAQANSVDELMAKNPEITEQINEVVSKVGEKTQVSRVTYVTIDNGYLAEYVHPGNKVGVLVNFANLAGDKQEAFAPVARNIAVQVAAMKPLSVSRDEVPQDIIAKELEIYRDQAKNEGKPENVIERIATGKLDKYYKEICLLEQDYFREQSNPRTIAQLVADFNKQNGTEVKVQSFALYQLGGVK